MLREGEITNRHNKIVRILVNFINRMGASATDLEVERRQYKSMVNINERPDIRAWIGEAQLLIEVTVTHPTAKSNITKALKPLGAADSAHKRKMRKHEKAAKKVGATLVLYVVYTFGGIGKAARDLHKLLTNYGARNNSELDRDEILSEIYGKVAVCLQEGNRQVLEVGLQQ